MPRQAYRVPPRQTRHCDVHNEKVARIALLKDCQRSLPAIGVGDKMTDLSEAFDGYQSNVRIVVDHQNAAAGMRPGADRHGVVGGPCRAALRPRQIDLNGRPFAYLAPNPDCPVGLTDDAEDRGEAQPGTLTDLLRGEEGLKGVLDHLRAHARSSVSYRHEDAVMVGDFLR